MPDTNTLAYLASSSATKEKSFITLTPWFMSGVSLGPGIPIETEVLHFFNLTREGVSREECPFPGTETTTSIF